MRKPYQTMTRERAVIYLRDCVSAGRDPIVAEAVRRGIGADRTSAKRCLKWAYDRICTGAQAVNM